MDKSKVNTMLNKYSGVEKFIERNHIVTVKNICDEYEISESTARRLLIELEKNNFIKRIHGGATTLKSGVPEYPIHHRSQVSADEKAAIAGKAVGLIRENESVLLMSGSTVNSMAPYLKEMKNITIVTNSIEIMTVLIDNSEVCIHSLGGTLDQREHRTEGVLMENNLKGLRADKVFMSARAIDLHYGLMSDTLSETSVYKSFFAAADKCIVLADHTKFASRGLISCLSLDDVETLITDVKTPQSLIDVLQSMDIEVLQS